jgi:hypothetical protein
MARSEINGPRAVDNFFRFENHVGRPYRKNSCHLHGCPYFNAAALEVPSLFDI